MQIFYLCGKNGKFGDPMKNAQALCDKHCVKMPLETFQIISTVWYITSPEKYKEFKEKGWLIKPWPNAKHPSIRWVSQSKGNYYWAVMLFIALCIEFSERYGHQHKYADYIKNLIPMGDPDIEKEDFVPMSKEFQAIPDELKNEDPVLAYRKYYLEKKASFAKWNKGRDVPDWFAVKN